jgi:hypothetical protein
MVRAGVVNHPVKWVNSGYPEIQQPLKRYRVIDLAGLLGLCGFSKLADFQQARARCRLIASSDYKVVLLRNYYGKSKINFCLLSCANTGLV